MVLPIGTWGTSIGVNFTGSSLSVTLDDQYGKNFFNVFVDHDLTHPIVIAAEKGEKKYVLADQLSSGKHSVLITKRTEGEEGATTIKGFELADGAKLLAPPVHPKHKIEFFTLFFILKAIFSIFVITNLNK